MKTKNYLLNEYNEVMYFDIPVRHYKTRRPIWKTAIAVIAVTIVAWQLANLYQVIMLSL